MVKHLQIVPYDSAWVAAFDAERHRIASAFGVVAVRIDHHGSTAVPGLEAKAIIDIQVSVARLSAPEAYAVPLAGIGYSHMPHPDDARCPFFHRPREWPHTHHIHVVESGSVEEHRTLAFRDYLRAHGDVAREYGALKRQLAARFAADSAASREAYAGAKGAFIGRVLQIALAEDSAGARRTAV